MAKFGILQECTVSGLKHWVQPGGMMAAGGKTNGGLGDPSSMGYVDRAAAEAGMEKLRARNASDVERSKRQRKFKTHPATYRIVVCE